MSHPYATLAYARTLAQIGEPIEVPEWGCHVLARPIKGDLADVTGAYPLAVLRPDADVPGGLIRLRERGFVSVVLVLDDFHRPPLAVLERSFGLMRVFKTHFLHRPSLGDPAYGKHHRYEIGRALRSVETGILDLAREGASWNSLYGTLMDRHRLGGSHAFGPDHVEALAAGAFEALGAWHEGELVSAHIWAVHEGEVHSHLAASSERGYALRAAYAVNAASLEHFSSAKLVNLGGAAGAAVSAADGLARFKRGFANDEAPAYIVGAVLRPDVYDRLSETAGTPESAGFFPAYRTASRRAAL